MRPTLTIALSLCAGCTEYDYAEYREHQTWDQASDIAAADVLFVVDNSASMSEEQARLGDNFAAFVDVVSDTFADFQLGVVTTDVDGAEAGVLRGGIMTSDDTDLGASFLTAIDVGTSGSRDERGFAAAFLAAAHPQNAGFVREGARFNIVIFSDEDDHTPQSVDEVMEIIDNLKGDGDYAFHGVIGDLPDGCASGAGAADAGMRYEQAIARSGGFQQSICSDDYSDLLTKVGLDVAGLTDTFLLDEVPEPDSIEVRVDTVLMHQRAIDGWRYSPGENALVFDGRSVPRPGMQVTATYGLLLGGQNTP